MVQRFRAWARAPEWPVDAFSKAYFDIAGDLVEKTHAGFPRKLGSAWFSSLAMAVLMRTTSIGYNA